MEYKTFCSVKLKYETFCSVKVKYETFRSNDTFFEIYRSSSKAYFFCILQGILVSFSQNTLFFYTFMKHLDLKTM